MVFCITAIYVLSIVDHIYIDSFADSDTAAQNVEFKSIGLTKCLFIDVVYIFLLFLFHHNQNKIRKIYVVKKITFIINVIYDIYVPTIFLYVWQTTCVFILLQIYFNKSNVWPLSSVNVANQ